MATHLVLGSSGFLGNHLSLELLRRGHKVIGIDLALPLKKPENFSFIQSDILDLSDHEFALEGVDCVYHCASAVPLLAGTVDLQKINVEGTVQVLRALRKIPFRHFTYVSSSAVAISPDSDPLPVPPDCLRAGPIEDYGLSKKLAEDLVIKECTQRGIPWSVIRPRTILGPGRLGIFELLFDWIKREKTIFIPGRADIPFQLIHVEDLIEAMILATNAPSGIYHVASESNQSLRDDLENVLSAVNSPSQVLELPSSLSVVALDLLARLRLSPLKRWHYMSFQKPFLLDTSSTKERLNWTPRYTNSKMLLECYHDFLSCPLPGVDASIHRSPLRNGFLTLAR